jgi:hypothetical protein
MIGSSPQFPALKEWQKMSESEQDTLINKMAAVRRRNSRIFIALFCATFGAAIAAALCAVGWL